MSRDRAAVLRDLAVAVHRYGVRVERTARSRSSGSRVPPAVDGTELGRLRFFEPVGGEPFMRTVILNEVTRPSNRRSRRTRAPAFFLLRRAYSPIRSGCEWRTEFFFFAL